MITGQSQEVEIDRLLRLLYLDTGRHRLNGADGRRERHDGWHGESGGLGVQLTRLPWEELPEAARHLRRVIQVSDPQALAEQVVRDLGSLAAAAIGGFGSAARSRTTSRAGGECCAGA
jgi:hypothetical protein